MVLPLDVAADVVVAGAVVGAVEEVLPVGTVLLVVGVIPLRAEASPPSS